MQKNQKPLVLFLISNIHSTGGIEAITISVANRLAIHGKILILNTDAQANIGRTRQITETNVQVDYLSKKGKLSRLFQTIKYIRKNKPRFVVIQGKNLYFFGYLSHFCNSCWVFFDHDSLCAYPNNQANEYLPRARVVKHVNKIAVLTQDNKQEYQRRLRVSPSKISVIPSFIDMPSYGSTYNLDSKIILSIGRLHRQKRYDLLIRAFGEICDQIPDWKLIIYGDGPERDSLIELIEELGLSSRALLPGRIPNVADGYKDAAFFVLSSEHEGFGLVLLEAFHYKLPVVSFDCPSGPADIIKNHENGLLVKNGDAKALGMAIKKLATDKTLRSVFSANTSQSLKQFDPDSIMEKWMGLLDIPAYVES